MFGAVMYGKQFFYTNKEQKMSTQVRFCLTCSWWDSGACHIKPPTINLSGGARFPAIGPLGWCGEHLQASEEAVASRKASLMPLAAVLTTAPSPVAPEEPEPTHNKPGTFDLDLSGIKGVV